jgi:hypothetical protein
MYRLILAPRVAAQFRRLSRLAEQRRLLNLFKRTAKHMEADLKSSPLKLGESRDVQKVGGFQRRIAFYPLICVQYGVHEQGKIVVITAVTPNG